jgi:hypothetical protein
MCSKLDMILANWIMDEAFLRDHLPRPFPPSSNPVPLPICMQNLTEINLCLASDTGIQVQLHVWDAITVLRLMLLPSIRKLSVTTITDRRYWPEDVAETIPHLYGTSTVDTLSLSQIAIEVAPVIHDLVKIPKGLT